MAQHVGLGFPLNIFNGSLQLDTNKTLIEKSIITLLAWPKYQFMLDREYGSRLEELIDEPNDSIVHALAYDFIYDALKTYEPRIKVLDIDISNASPDIVSIDLKYLIKDQEVIEKLGITLNR